MRLKLGDDRIIEVPSEARGVEEVIDYLIDAMEMVPIVDIAELCSTCGPRVAKVINRYVAQGRLDRMGVARS